MTASVIQETDIQIEQLRSTIKIRLLKGPLYRNKQRHLWEVLERDQALIRSYFDQIGLSLRLDDAEGYAFLQQRDFEQDDESVEIPRLITRRQLSFGQTLLLVFLRKRLAEHDSEESSPRLVVQRQEIWQWLKPHFPEVGNEVKQHKEFDALIKKVAEMGFLSQLPNHKSDFEVQRILKAFVTAEQIGHYIQLFEGQQFNKNLKPEERHHEPC